MRGIKVSNTKILAIKMPTSAQLQGLYRIGFYLTYLTFQPIYLMCIDRRTGNLFILAGHDEDIQVEITPDGEVF